MEKEKLNLSQGDGEIPPMRLGEVGTTGLSHRDGYVEEEIRSELKWPHVVNTYKTMYHDPMIYAGINLIEMMISKVKWDVKPPENATEAQLEKCAFIKQCQNDMELSWEEFIKEVLSYLLYGFCVMEKVYRRRTPSKGSKYSDNLIGWRKLAIRSQDTIEKWGWSKDGRELTHVYQDLSRIEQDGRFDFFFNSPDKEPKGLKIKRNKFMLFRYNAKRGNPLGCSPLKACYIPYKFKTIIEESEAIGITRDLTGMPVLGLHPKYMSPDATDADKAIYEYYKKVINNISNNEQSGLIYPLMYNEQGKKIIEFDLMSVQGGKQYDTDKIIKRFDDKMLTALFADILKLGQDSHGSFSLAGAKTNIVAMNIEARLKEIADVLNNDLIPQTYKQNGWEDTEFCKFVYEDLDEEDLDEFSKMVQRIGSIGYLPKNKDIVSQIIKRSGFEGYKDILSMSDEEFEKQFPEATSRSGDGMKTAGEGTSDKPSGSDSSTSNTENS